MSVCVYLSMSVSELQYTYELDLVIHVFKFCSFDNVFVKFKILGVFFMWSCMYKIIFVIYIVYNHK